MIELIGCVPQMSDLISKDLSWLKDQLNASKDEIRENVATLFALVLNTTQDAKYFDKTITDLIKQSSNKNLESQHGAILAIGTCLEMKLMNKQIVDPRLFKDSVTTLLDFMTNQNSLIVGGACTSLGLIAKHSPLPLDDGKPVTADGSPDAKRPNNTTTTKYDVVKQLIDVMRNGKFSSKVREKAAKTLGFLCVGEKFPHTREVIQGLLDTAKETKDVEVHFTIGEALVMCCQGVHSIESRNPWLTSPDDFIETDEDLPHLEWSLDELLDLANQTHPNSKQASAIWLLAVLKGCGRRQPITNKVKILQNVFMGLLCENNGKF